MFISGLKQLGLLYLTAILLVGSSGVLAPARRAAVGRKSANHQTALLTFPAGIRPGQRTIMGTRIPPS